MGGVVAEDRKRAEIRERTLDSSAIAVLRSFSPFEVERWKALLQWTLIATLACVPCVRCVTCPRSVVRERA